MTLPAQRTDSQHSVEIIGVVMGSLVHYFPRPIGTTVTPIRSLSAYALQVVIPPHANIDPGSILIIDRQDVQTEFRNLDSNMSNEGFYVARSGKTGKVIWHSNSTSSADRVVWIGIP